MDIHTLKKENGVGIIFTQICLVNFRTKDKWQVAL